MATFNSHTALSNAIGIVTAGLQSGSIKLHGAATGGYNDANIKEDAKYLNELINALAENLGK